mgnify:CR=1 FL=1
MYAVFSIMILSSVYTIVIGLYGWHFLFYIGIYLYLLVVLLVSINVKEREIWGHSQLLLTLTIISDMIDYLLYGELPRLQYYYVFLVLLIALSATIPAQLYTILKSRKMCKETSI